MSKYSFKAMLLTLCLCPCAYSQTHSLPVKPLSDADAAQIIPTAKPRQATRLPRRDTHTPLICSSADAAPKLSDRTADGSCRSHTKEHRNQDQHAQDILPTYGIPAASNAITGR
jgi:hypothetical protein